MFAIVALICWVLALFDVQIGSIDLVVFGLCFFALHFVAGSWTPWRRR